MIVRIKTICVECTREYYYDPGRESYNTCPACLFEIAEGCRADFDRHEEHTIPDLMGERDEAEKRNDELDKEVAQLKQRIDELETERDKREAVCDRLRDEAERYRTELSKWRSGQLRRLGSHE